MASKTTTAAQKKVASTAKAPAFKGKYPGPDKYKGKPPPKPAAKPKPAPKVTAPKAPNPNPTNLYEEPDPSNTVSNDNGGVELQTNFDLEREAADAESEYAQTVAEAATTRQYAATNKTARKNSLLEDTKSATGQTNAQLAARGMTGDVAQGKLTELTGQIGTEDAAIEKEASDTEAEVVNRLTTAGTRRDLRKAGVTTGRQDYTNTRSATAPTVGSKPVSSGVSGTTLPVKAPTAPKATTKPAAKPTFKGKYAGPDVFKGDAKKLAAWRKAGKPKQK